MHKISEANSAQIYYLIPEFNCKDWIVSTSYSYDVRNKNLSTCIDLQEKIKHNYFMQNNELTEKYCHQYISLNCYDSYVYEMLFLLSYKKGDFEQANNYKRQAIENVFYGPLFNTALLPMCPDSVKDIIKDYCKQYCFEYIDVAQEFSYYLNGDLPGNNLFIDYCHMTIEGMLVACRPLAAKILADCNIIFDNVKMPKAEIKQSQLAVCYFFAGIHASHSKRQSEEYLKNHFIQALNYDDSIKQSFFDYIISAITKVLWCFNKDYINLFLRHSINHYVLKQSYYIHLLDITIVEAMVKALSDKHISLPFDLNSILLKNHNIQRTNLLETYYSQNSLEQLTLLGFKNPIYLNTVYFTAISHKSEFIYITDGRNCVKFQMTLRTMDNTGKLTLLINDVKLQEIEVDSYWKDIEVTINRNYFSRDGINKIELLWPIENCSTINSVQIPSNDYFHQLISRFSNFGQIYRFNAIQVRTE